MIGVIESIRFKKKDSGAGTVSLKSESLLSRASRIESSVDAGIELWVVCVDVNNLQLSSGEYREG